MLSVDPENVVHYLAERRLLTFESVVDGDFMVLEQSSRNYNLKVLRRRVSRLLHQAGAQPLRRLHPHPGARGEVLRDRGAQPPLRRHGRAAPPCHHWDAANARPRPRDAPRRREPVGAPPAAAARFPREIAELQGDKLGTYHRQAELFFPALEELRLFDKKLPWILSIHETHPQYLSQMSQGNAQLLQILQRLPRPHPALDALKRSWASAALLHGDIKWENLLLYRESEDGAARPANHRLGDGRPRRRVLGRRGDPPGLPELLDLHRSRSAPGSPSDQAAAGLALPEGGPAGGPRRLLDPLRRGARLQPAAPRAARSSAAWPAPPRAWCRPPTRGSSSRRRSPRRRSASSR